MPVSDVEHPPQDTVVLTSAPVPQGGSVVVAVGAALPLVRVHADGRAVVTVPSSKYETPPHPCSEHEYAVSYP